MIVTKLKLFQEKKNSVRFNAEEDDPGITSAYVMKSHLSRPWPTNLVSLILTPEQWEQVREALEHSSQKGASQ